MTGRIEPGTPSLPPWAARLGYAGLLPFVFCAAVALAMPEPEVRHLAGRALLSYGAVILSFLGGVHWGVVLADRPGRSAGMLMIGVLPSLGGWATLFLGFETAVAVQVACFGGFWLYEHRVLGTGALPAPYLAMRRWLTLVACASLGLALMAPTLTPTRL